MDIMFIPPYLGTVERFVSWLWLFDLSQGVLFSTPTVSMVDVGDEITYVRDNMTYDIWYMILYYMIINYKIIMNKSDREIIS